MWEQNLVTVVFAINRRLQNSQMRSIRRLLLIMAPIKVPDCVAAPTSTSHLVSARLNFPEPWRRNRVPLQTLGLGGETGVKKVRKIAYAIAAAIKCKRC